MYIIFKDKNSKRSNKAVGIKVFLTFLLGDRRIQEVQKHVDPIRIRKYTGNYLPLAWEVGRSKAEAVLILMRVRLSNGKIHQSAPLTVLFWQYAPQNFKLLSKFQDQNC
jgi:hypothetical protein